MMPLQIHRQVSRPMPKELLFANNALEFNGVNQIVSVPDKPEFDTGDEITVETWFYTEVNQNAKTFILHDLSAYKYMLYLTGNSGRMVFYVMLATLSQPADTGALAAGYFTNRWHQAVGTFKRSLATNRVKLYIDGLLAAQCNGINSPIDAGDEGITIGQGAGGLYTGLQTQQRILSSALNAYEVWDSYCQGRARLNRDSILNFNFEEGVGLILHDESPFGNDGDLLPALAPQVWRRVNKYELVS